VVEARDRILPTYDKELTQPVAESLKQLGIKLYLEHSVDGFSRPAAACRCAIRMGESQTLETDQVLVAVGRGPRTQGFNLEALA
jgi:dihydrolipoamide dehydrogenase